MVAGLRPVELMFHIARRRNSSPFHSDSRQRWHPLRGKTSVRRALGKVLAGPTGIAMLWGYILNLNESPRSFGRITVTEPRGYGTVRRDGTELPMVQLDRWQQLCRGRRTADAGKKGTFRRPCTVLGYKRLRLLPRAPFGI